MPPPLRLSREYPDGEASPSHQPAPPTKAGRGLPFACLLSLAAQEKEGAEQGEKGASRLRHLRHKRGGIVVRADLLDVGTNADFPPVEGRKHLSVAAACKDERCHFTGIHSVHHRWAVRSEGERSAEVDVSSSGQIASAP